MWTMGLSSKMTAKQENIYHQEAPPPSVSAAANAAVMTRSSFHNTPHHKVAMHLIHSFTFTCGHQHTIPRTLAIFSKSKYVAV
jgi:hypothetical protein